MGVSLCVSASVYTYMHTCIFLALSLGLWGSMWGWGRGVPCTPELVAADTLEHGHDLPTHARDTDQGSAERWGQGSAGSKALRPGDLRS